MLLAFSIASALFFTVLLHLNCVYCAEECSTYGDVRLVGGSGSWEGNVQVCMNGTWGYVCDNSWSTVEARGVCYQLGYGYRSAYVSTRSNSYFGSGNGTVHLDNLYCSSVFTKLVNCTRGSIACDPYKDIAGVVCRIKGTCTFGAVRLTADSASYGRSTGRVEVCHNSQWGTVCRYPNWDSNNTDVVCRQLGYQGDDSYTYSYTPYGFGSTTNPIKFRNVDCVGNESSLFDCSKSISSSGCNHSNDVGVRCSSKDTSSCTSGSIRLWSAYKDTPSNEGMIQICRNGRWYGMCDSYYSCHIGRVACQTLGYSAGAVTLQSNAGRYYGFFDDIDMYRYKCSSSPSTSFSQCGSSYSYSCGNYALGVICSTATQQSEPTTVNECTNGDVRLVNGTTENEGRVEYCYEGLWSPMCSLSTLTAKLVCKKLGYKHYQYMSIDYSETFGVSKTASQFDHLSCFFDYSISDCTVRLRSSTCYVSTPSACSSQYGLTCFEPSKNCNSGDIRLQGGIIEQEGRPEVCVNGVWGSICDNGWGTVEAYIFCKTLGYEGPVPSVFSRSYFGGNFSVWSYLNCHGWESNITQCSKFELGSCSTSEIAGTRCKDKCQTGDIKLVGGDFPDEGTVQVCYNNLWGQILARGWSDVDAKVVCRYLGYDTKDATAVTNSKYGKYNLTVHLRRVRCTGNEYSISECSKTINTLSKGQSLLGTTTNIAGVDCEYNGPTILPCVSATPTDSPTCTNTGSFRLVDSNGEKSTTEGRFEYCNGQYWTPVCTMDNKAAQVACKELGHIHYSWGSVLDTGHDYGTLQNYSLIINISCTGDEGSISDCSANNAPTDCLPVCSNRNIGLRCFTSDECDDGSVRLVNGLLEHEGRAEICLNGVWGTICDNQWDKTDGHVFCQQLGHPVAEAHIFRHSWFGSGRYPIVYSNVQCNGWESSISQCDHNGYTDTTCSRGHVAGVLCGYNCSDGDVRLMDGPNPYEGTVEVCFDSIWGLVDENGWSLNDAKVVCSQLGYGTNANDIKPRSGSYYGKSNLTVHLSDLQCDGTEESLTDCLQTTYSLEEGKERLSSVEVAGVRCNVPTGCEAPPTGGNEYECTEGDIRLSGTGNVEDMEGRVEYCHKGYWTQFCSMTDKEAVVACRQLGFYRTQYASVFTNRKFSNDLQGDSITSYIENITCASGKQNDLSQCITIDGCQQTCRNPIEIKCFDAVASGSSSLECEDDTIRLVDGQNVGEGRIEVCYDNIWGSVCGQNFDFEAATVACSQLGVEGSRPQFSTNTSFSDGGKQPILMSNVKCTGQEDRLVDCKKSTYLNFNCSRKNLAGVKCKEDCGERRVRLVGGQSQAEGTVEICYNGEWGLVASNGWSNNDAVVVCRQLGYTNERFISVTDSRYGKTNRSIIFNQVECSGDEDTIFECTKDEINLSENFRNLINISGVSCLGKAPQIGGQTNKEDCGERRVRLVGGQSQAEGTVEICYNGEWGLVASNGWSNNDAVVVCRQLGYASEGVVSVSRYDKTNRSIIFNQVECSGEEDTIFECTKSEISLSENIRDLVNISGVSCLGNAPQIDRNTGNDDSKDSSMMIAMVFLAICLAVTITIISILVIVWLKRRSSKSDLSISSHAPSSTPPVTMSSVNPTTDDEDFDKDTMTESPSFDEKILSL